jgi:hypothetical protein
MNLLEDDLDTTEMMLREEFKAIRSEIKNYSRILIGILVSLATASVLLAANIVAGGA